MGKGEPTLIACSGGADSSALVLALAAVADNVVIGHVVHDLRARAEALADRDAARTLAEVLGVRFVEREVRAQLASMRLAMRPGRTDIEDAGTAVHSAEKAGASMRRAPEGA